MTPRSIDLSLTALAVGAASIAATVHGFHLTGRAETWTFVTLTVAQAVACGACAVKLLGARAAGWLAGLSLILGWGWEQLGVATGVPFGPYHYTDVLGMRLGLVPLIIPAAWFTVMFMTFVITNLILDGRPSSTGSVGRIAWSCVVGGFVTAAFDLPADPFMVQTAKAWVMEDQGPFFNEQFRGFVGWLIVSFTILMVFRLIHRAWCPPARDDVSVVAVALPLALYAAWGAFFAVIDSPPGVRVVATFAMGVPALVAASRLIDWNAARKPAA